MAGAMIDTSQIDERAGRGSHLAAISRRVVGLMKQHYGKGPTGARTYHSGDLVVVLLSGGYTTVEKTLIAGGRGDAVTSQRSAFQETIKPLMRQIIEEELQRPVIAFMSASHQDPDLSAELFVLGAEDGSSNGDGRLAAAGDVVALSPNGEGSQDGSAGDGAEDDRGGGPETTAAPGGPA